MNIKDFSEKLDSLFDKYNNQENYMKAHTGSGYVEEEIVEVIVEVMQTSEENTIAYLNTTPAENIEIIAGYLEDISEEFQSYTFVDSLLKIFDLKNIPYAMDLYNTAATIAPKFINDKEEIMEYLDIFHKQILKSKGGITELINSWQELKRFPRILLKEWICYDYRHDKVTYYIHYPIVPENVRFTFSIEEHIDLLNQWRPQDSEKIEYIIFKQGIPKFPKLEQIVPLPFHEKTNQFIIDYKELSEKALWEKYKLQSVWFNVNDYVEASKKYGNLGKTLIQLLVKFECFAQLDCKEDVNDYEIENFWGDEPVKLVQFDLENDSNYYAYIPQSTDLKSILDVKIYNAPTGEEK